MDSIEKIIGGFRTAIQDLLVPELKAIKTELQHHNEQFKKIDQQLDKLNQRIDKNQAESNKRFEALQRQIDERFEAFRKEMDQRFEAFRKEMDQRFEAVLQRLANLDTSQTKVLEKFDSLEKQLQIDRRLTHFEGRFAQMERVMLAEKGGKKEVAV
ncbi:hypothetical protein JXJ21_26480 [candidate division KSB1 bacterium]|nr:hypothetical protein [candidate division KSB1 bacterium]